MKKWLDLQDLIDCCLSSVYRLDFESASNSSSKMTHKLYLCCLLAWFQYISLCVWHQQLLMSDGRTDKTHCKVLKWGWFECMSWWRCMLTLATYRDYDKAGLQLLMPRSRRALADVAMRDSVSLVDEQLSRYWTAYRGPRHWMKRSDRLISETPSLAGSTSAASPDFFDTFQVLHIISLSVRLCPSK